MALVRSLIAVSLGRLCLSLLASGGRGCADIRTLLFFFCASLLLAVLVDAGIRSRYPGIRTLGRGLLALALAGSVLSLGSGLWAAGSPSGALDLVCSLVALALTLASASGLGELIHGHAAGNLPAPGEAELVARLRALGAVPSTASPRGWRLRTENRCEVIQ
jgi:hypothetical protein